MDTTWLDATAQADMVRRGEVSPAELVDAAIARIEKVNPQLDAVIRTRFDQARLEARRGLPDGPLRDLPWPVTSYLAEQFVAAGLVVLGRTNVPESGTTVTTEPKSFPATRNPWNPGHSAGGSSGGSAAA